MNEMLTLLLLSSVLVSFSVCIHSQIKHYPNVTLDTCGIGRQSLLTTKNCFKWSSNVTTSVQNGRLAQPGEWPWIYFDIALLKLNSHIPITRTAGYYTVNGICLPEINIVNIDDELALVAGFGYIDRGVSNPGPLRTGWLKLMKTFGNITDIFGARIRAFRYPTNGGMATCMGDSGGPLVQNVLSSDSSDGQNRAVLIGVIGGASGKPPVGYCHNPDPDSAMVFLRVSKFIDWIVDTVLNNA
ncbi:chymotrypsin-like elastase family member 2A [Oppia nitens]|uniref:chymotrypsin-like elastase family member 2A n=1 Tax=Oppia nitens TaxID=1686743 RepID=UPI0023DB25E0|nr:chymotrypsin-like elastase family member 2A [Oppia nitens]